jgi:RNA polymerase sigma-70 factor (ECF subfamily)
MKSPNITEEEVGMIKRAQAGDKLAFNHIFERYKPFIEKVLFSYLKDMDEAKDLTNIVFLKVYDKLSTFKAYNSFGGWLRIIANNTAIDYLRTINKSIISLKPEKDSMPTDGQTSYSEDDIADHLTYKQILELFDELPEQKKEICLMFYQDRMTVKDISNMLNVPTGTIKSVLSRTRKKIKKQLNI